MATDFPTSLDALTNPTSTDNLDSTTVPHATQHANANDAIEALQAKVGVDESAVPSSHDYKLGFVRIGTSTPEGAVTAAVGALFLRTNGGGGTTLYVKESGAGNTGWVAVVSATDHIADSSDAHDASAISILDTANDFTATDVEGALAELQADNEAHLADASAAHAASAISFSPTGTVASTDVQAAIAEIATEAGQTGDLLDWQFFRKTGTETVTSSTVLQDDNHLLFAIGASETWVWDALLITGAGTETPDIKIAWTVPASAAVDWSAHGLVTGATAISGDLAAGALNVSGSELAYGGAPARAGILVRGIVVNSTNAGNVTLQWAQNTSSGTAQGLTENSYLIARRVA